MKLARVAIVGSTVIGWLASAKFAFAQSASTLSAGTGKGGTGSALLDAGSQEVTYILFFGGLLLFILGSFKIASSFKD